MTRFAMCFLLLASMVSSSFGAVLVKGDIIKLNYSGTSGGANGGGEFAIWKLTSPQNTPDVWTQVGETFCLEFNEHFSLNTKMIVGAVSDFAFFGGPSTPSIDQLSAGTKDLYISYLDGYLASNLNFNANQLANATQEAIWFLEGERSVVSSNAQQLINVAASRPSKPSNNGVVALNLFHINTPSALLSSLSFTDPSTWVPLKNYRQQDQIFYMPPPSGGPTPTVPEPASIAIFAIGSALVGMARFRSKRRSLNVA